MSDRSGDTCLSAIVESHCTTVRERELKHTLALLASHLTCHRTIDLVGQPVLTSHAFEAEYIINICLQLAVACLHVLILMFHSRVVHVGLWRMTEHVGKSEVDRLDAICLFECEAHVVGCLTNHEEWAALALGNLPYALDVLLLDEEAHTLLALVARNLLCAQSWVTDRELVHIDLTASGIDELREAVDMTACTVVMDRDNRVVVAFAERTHHVVGTLLHLRVGTLHCIELDGTGILTSVDRRNGATTHTDAVVVTTDEDDLLAWLWLTLERIAQVAVTYTAGKHDHLVETILDWLRWLTVLESEERTADERLTELVTEVARTVRCLDEHLLWCLVEPWTSIHHVLPRLLLVARVAWIRCDIDSSTGNRH